MGDFGRQSIIDFASLDFLLRYELEPLIVTARSAFP